MTPRPLTAASLRFIAGAHRHAALVFSESDNPCRRRFAAVLDGWADRADADADAIGAARQPDLFGEAA